MSWPEEHGDPIAAASRELLSCRVAGTEFAFDVEGLCEVVELVEIMRVRPRGGTGDGIINYRGTVIPVLDTSRVLGFGASVLDPQAHIVVTDVGGDKTGLIVDGVDDVLAVPQDAIDRPGARVPLRRFVSGIAKLDGRLLLVLDIAAVLEHAAAEGSTRDRAAAEPAPAHEVGFAAVLRQRAVELSRPVQQPAADSGNAVTTVCFRMHDGAYAIRAELAKEVVAPPPLTPIPCTPPYVLGAVNIRGAIVPILALAEFLGTRPGADDRPEDARIIVTEDRGTTVGLFVSEVLGVFEVAATDMAPPMDAIEATAMSFIEAEFDLDGRVVCAVDAAGIIKALEEMDGPHEGPSGRGRVGSERGEADRQA